MVKITALERKIDRALHTPYLPGGETWVREDDDSRPAAYKGFSLAFEMQSLRERASTL